MKKIAISTLILSVSLYSGMFEHSTDVKQKYWFDLNKQVEDEQLALELEKFQHAKATQSEIDKYIRQRDEDNVTRPFAKDVYVDAGILKQRILQNDTDKLVAKKDKSCGWFFSLFGCNENEEDSTKSVSKQSDVQIKKTNEMAEETLKKLNAEVENEDMVEEKGALQDSVDAVEVQETQDEQDQGVK